MRISARDNRTREPRRSRSDGAQTATERLARDDLARGVGVDERAGDIGIELRAGAALHLGDRPVERPGVAVGTRGRHRVERVGDREQPALERDVAARAARRVAASRPSARDGTARRAARVRARGSRRSARRPRPDGREPRRAPPRRAGPACSRTPGADVHLADVVQGGTEAQARRARSSVPAEPAARSPRRGADARRRGPRARVADAHRGGEDGKPAHEG